MEHEYDVVFYEDESGHQPVIDYMRQLQGENTKDARIKLNKIRDYVKLLNTILNPNIDNPAASFPLCLR